MTAPTRESALARMDFLVRYGLSRDRANWLRVWLAAAMDAGLPPPHAYGTADLDGASLEWPTAPAGWTTTVTFEAPWPTAYVWVCDSTLGVHGTHDALVPVDEGFTARLVALLTVPEAP